MIILMYILAIFIPPIPAFVYGGVKHGLLNILLCLLIWIPAIVHAMIVISNRDQTSSR